MKIVKYSIALLGALTLVACTPSDPEVFSGREFETVEGNYEAIAFEDDGLILYVQPTDENAFVALESKYSENLAYYNGALLLDNVEINAKCGSNYEVIFEGEKVVTFIYNEDDYSLTTTDEGLVEPDKVFYDIDVPDEDDNND